MSDLVEDIKKDEAAWQHWLSYNDDAQHDELVHAAFIAGRESLQAEIAELRDESDNQHKLIVRQSTLLTNAVNALRGPPPDDTLWSHHDVAELASESRTRIRSVLEQLETGFMSCACGQELETKDMDIVSELREMLAITRES